MIPMRGENHGFGFELRIAALHLRNHVVGLDLPDLGGNAPADVNAERDGLEVARSSRQSATGRRFFRRARASLVAASCVSHPENANAGCPAGSFNWGSSLPHELRTTS